MNCIEWFLLGFVVCAILAIIADNSYKNCLIMSARDGHDEKIKGEWYSIKKVESQ